MNPYYEHKGISIYHCDCTEILPYICADVLITDPPYGIGTFSFDKQFPQNWYRLVHARIVVIITGSQGVKDSLSLVGSDFIDVIAAHNLNGMTDGPIGMGNWLAAVVARGKPRQGINAFSFVVNGDKPDHPTPKPLSFMRKLVERVTEPQESVLDPFMGSGTTLLAAKILGRKAIGIEIEERYCEIAATRLSQEIFDFGEPQPFQTSLFMEAA